MDDNKKTLPDNFVEKSFEELCSLLAESGDKDFIYDFFNCLFTPSEMTDFAKRWQLVKDLDNGVTQREIEKKYNMSICKITRGSKMLKQNGSAFRKMLDKLK